MPGLRRILDDPSGTKRPADVRSKSRQRPPSLREVDKLAPEDILALQRATGNAAVTSLLLQRDAGAPVQTPAPPAKAAPDPAQDAKDLLDEKLATSKDYAAWLLDARDKGFVQFTPGYGSEAQVEKLKKGEKIGEVDPTAATVIPALLTMYDVVKGPITRWAAKPSDPKPVVMLGSFIRPAAGRHTKGQAIDINETNFTGNADQLISILGDLSPGKYGLGIPFQGDFLPAERDLRAKEAAEAKKAEPATLTHMLLLDYGSSYKATWDKDKKDWIEEEDDGDDVRTSIKSAALKTNISDLSKAGVKFEIFADRKGHFHIDRR